jgi:hypothetical protein
MRLSRSGSFAVVRAQHPERDLFAVDGRRQLCLDPGRLLLLLAGERAEVARAGELPQLARTPVAVHRRADAVRHLERGQLAEAVVDRLELELVLVPGEVEVVLLVDRRDEAVRLLAVVVQLSGGRDCCHQRGRRIPACRRSESTRTRRPS